VSAIVVGVVAAAAAISMEVSTMQRALTVGPLPAVPERSTFGSLFDLTPMALTITENWEKVPTVVPAYLVKSDVTLWRKMHFEDWNVIPQPVREAGLSAMMARYGTLFAPGHRNWSNMSSTDWDEIPQPIRAIAFIRMAQHWAAHYAIGREYGLSPAAMADTVGAIIMAESWFEHRGFYTNPDGSTDIGLGGSSAYCRRVLRARYDHGEIDFTLQDEQYFNPWDSSRAVAVWFQMMLDEAEGDVDLAIGAYHVGIAAARDGGGHEYVASVKRKRRRFIRDDGAPEAWHFVYRRIFQPAAAAADP
jgi:hypothetical protein